MSLIAREITYLIKNYYYFNKIHTLYILENNIIKTTSLFVIASLLGKYTGRQIYNHLLIIYIICPTYKYTHNLQSYVSITKHQKL